MRAMALSLGLPEDYFDAQLIDDSYWIMRVIGYPPLDGVPRGQASFVVVSVIGYPPVDGVPRAQASLDSTRACAVVGHSREHWRVQSETLVPVSCLMNIGCKCGK
jgi:isopenicillin N synthase-like dioxygenase